MAAIDRAEMLAALRVEFALLDARVVKLAEDAAALSCLAIGYDLPILNMVQFWRGLDVLREELRRCSAPEPEGLPK